MGCFHVCHRKLIVPQYLVSPPCTEIEFSGGHSQRGPFLASFAVKCSHRTNFK
jgi:hypothetical protein